MKTLTISQPYASLIASGEKFVENRCWKTNYRGELAIHAGLGRQYLTKKRLADYPTGCVVAVANLAACVSIDEILEKQSLFYDRDNLIPGSLKSWMDVAFHGHTEGPFCWILEDVRKLETPIKATGKQGLWNFDADIETRSMEVAQ